jgi:16S rRNA (cytosine1402-N4)-methyltransferase
MIKSLMGFHESVLDNELKEFLQMAKNTYGATTLVDCTYGGGNHSQIALNEGYYVYGFDQDPNIEYIDNDNFKFQYENFVNIKQEAHIWIADLGLSDMQLQSHRGFSFMKSEYTNDNILDMRMNPQIHKPLKDIINYMPKYEIINILKEFGEEPSAKKIASNIELFRLRQKIKTTNDFIEAIGTNKYSILARVFQAFRIYINDELNALDKLLKNMDLLALKGAAIITFHSLEDRMVKHHWKPYKGKYSTDSQCQNKARSAKLRYFFR